MTKTTQPILVRLLNWLERKHWEFRQNTAGHIRSDKQLACLCCPPVPRQWSIK